MKNDKASNLFNDSFYIIDLQQGTTEWLEWRRSGIGASDAHVAMTSGFRTRQTLIKEKKGVLTRDYQSKAMEEGHQLEPEARTLYIKTTGKKVSPACIQSSRYEWLIASLDGISEDRSTVVEIKCGVHTYKTIQESGEIPRLYYSQVQHILAVTGLNSIDFWCYRPNKESLLLPIKRDNEYIEDLLQAESALWNEMKSSTSKKIKENPVKRVTKKPKDKPKRQLDPHYADSYVTRGLAYYNSGENDKALQDYTEAIRLDPTYSIAYFQRGLAYHHSGEYKKAIEDSTESIRLNPNYANAYVSRGVAYHMLGEYEKALQNYDEAIRLNPVDKLAIKNRKLALAKMN